MSAAEERAWHGVHLCCILFGYLVASSSSLTASNPMSVSSTVGGEAVLPCQWKPRLGKALLPTLHVQWQTPRDSVYEQRGAEKWQAGEFVGRVEVPEERLQAGDCSLVVRDVQFGDTGLYESFMVVDGTRVKKRVFIQSVRLLVYGHKTLQSRCVGEDMVLDLHTSRSTRLVFQARNSSEWTSLWIRGLEETGRLEKNPDREQLTLKSLTYTDDGFYKVLDEYGLSLSTVQLAVEENPPEHRRPLVDQQRGAAGRGNKAGYTPLCVVLSWVVTFLAPHLF